MMRDLADEDLPGAPQRATLCTPAYSTRPFRIYCFDCDEIDVVDTCGNELARIKRGEGALFAMVTVELKSGETLKAWRRIE